MLWIAALLPVFIALYYFFRNQPEGGFLEFLKRPGKFERQHADWCKTRDDLIQSAPGWDDTIVDEAVQDYVWNGQTVVLGALNVLPQNRVHRSLTPILAKILDKPSAYEPKRELQDTPATRAIELIGTRPTAEIREACIKLFESGLPRIRKATARAMAKTGLREFAGCLADALKSDDAYVRMAVLDHLPNTSDAGNESLFKVLEEEILTTFSQKGSEKEATEACLRNGAGARIESLLTAISPDTNPAVLQIAGILNGYEECAEKPSRQILLNLLTRLESSPHQRSTAYALGKVLRTLGKHRHSGDVEMLEKYAKDNEPRVATNACLALLESAGITDYERRILSEETIPSVLAPLRRVFIHHSEVNNGGYAQYYANRSGKDAAHVASDYEILGMPLRAALTREADAWFGSQPPASEQALRRKQLARLIRANETTFESIDSRYYALEKEKNESAELAMARYALKHKETFAQAR